MDLTPTDNLAPGDSALQRRLFLILASIALIYAFLAGLRTVSEPDLGWQLATGRWVAQHHAIPSTDVLSYTAAGQPWIYPVGAGLIFYAAYLLGGYALISWIGAAACVGTIALLLRRGSAVSAAIAILAVPVIAYRTGPRADMFTVVLFAAFLSLLWENYRTGRARIMAAAVADGGLGESASRLRGGSGADRRLCCHGIVGHGVLRIASPASSAKAAASGSVIRGHRGGHAGESLGLGNLFRAGAAAASQRSSPVLDWRMDQRASELERAGYRAFAAARQERNLCAADCRRDCGRNGFAARASGRGHRAAGRDLSGSTLLPHGGAVRLRGGGDWRSRSGDDLEPHCASNPAGTNTLTTRCNRGPAAGRAGTATLRRSGKQPYLLSGLGTHVVRHGIGMGVSATRSGIYCAREPSRRSLQHLR